MKLKSRTRRTTTKSPRRRLAARRARSERIGVEDRNNWIARSRTVFIGALLENQRYRSTAPVSQNSSFTCTAIMRGLLSPPSPTPSKPVGGDVV
jgi:hypothetical protein